MILSCDSIHQFYNQGDEKLHILNGINFSLSEGEIVALVGSSGSGKSTFLHIAGLLEQPTQGNISVNDVSVFATSTKTVKNPSIKDRVLTELRRKYIGFIYQFHHLLPEFTAIENVMLPLIVSGVSKKEAYAKANRSLEKMGLAHRINHIPSKLSGGEQQRVAIARALIHDPKILLADEPTGNLDNETAARVFDELLSLIREKKLGALIATHDLALAQKMDRIVRLTNGVLEEVASNPLDRTS